MPLETIGVSTGSTDATSVTASASADTYGSYAELVASTGQDCERMTVFADQVTGGANRSTVIAIATGAASSEVDQFELLLPGGGVANAHTVSIEVPITIASGTRISARAKSSLGSTNVVVSAIINDDDSYGTGGAHELIGVSGSAGTSIDPGGTTNTKGSWTELAASTSHDYDLIWVFIGHNDNTATNNARWLFDVGTGAASSETVVVANISKRLSIFEGPNSYIPIHLPTAISSGTRVAVRSQCNITDATDRIRDVAILGINLTAPSGGGAATTASGFMV